MIKYINTFSCFLKYSQYGRLNSFFIKFSSSLPQDQCCCINLITLGDMAVILTNPRQNGHHFGRKHFHIHFLEWIEFRFEFHWNMFPGGRFKNTYELLNQRALKFSYVNKIHIFQCMGKIFCVEFQRYPLKFHTKYLTHTLKDMIFMQFWNFKSS